MEELIKKLQKLNDLIKAIKKQAAPGPTLPDLPQPKQPSPPSMTPSMAKAPKIGTGAGPDSKKDPKKVAQQIRDGSMSTKTQKVMLKADSQTGQWYLEKGRNSKRLGGKHGGYRSSSVGRTNATVPGGKQYSSATFGSTKQQVAAQQKELEAKNKLQPVKVFSEEEKAALAFKMGLKKEDILKVDPTTGQWDL
jgi:hypothetical protein